jgi:FKBP-type peptidyl-prolyl cis-trans isomerase FklB
MSDDNNSIEFRASYGIGMQMGQQLASNPFEGMSLNGVLDGLKDAFEQNEQKFSNEDIQAAFNTINQRMQREQQAQFEHVIQAGEDFLKQNASKEEIQVTDSGLQYEVLHAGSGSMPTATDKVRTHYEGKLLDGSVFDSSYQRGEPTEFPVNGVIKGWTEALQLMEEGAKWRLYIPHDLAYGEQGAGGAIGPYETLVFDIELLAVL